MSYCRRLLALAWEYRGLLMLVFYVILQLLLVAVPMVLDPVSQFLSIRAIYSPMLDFCSRVRPSFPFHLLRPIRHLQRSHFRSAISTTWSLAWWRSYSSALPISGAGLEWLQSARPRQTRLLGTSRGNWRSVSAVWSKNSQTNSLTIHPYLVLCVCTVGKLARDGYAYATDWVTKGIYLCGACNAVGLCGVSLKSHQVSQVQGPVRSIGGQSTPQLQLTPPARNIRRWIYAQLTIVALLMSVHLGVENVMGDTCAGGPGYSQSLEASRNGAVLWILSSFVKASSLYSTDFWSRVLMCAALLWKDCEFPSATTTTDGEEEEGGDEESGEMGAKKKTASVE